MKALLFIFSLLICTVGLKSQELNLIPYPKNVKQLSGFYSLVKGTELVAEKKEFQPLLQYFNQAWAEQYKVKNKQELSVKLSKVQGGISGSYTLRTDTKFIQIAAPDDSGLFNGLTTLLQLCLSATANKKTINIPRLIIQDEPQFGWRGVMLDESRHFFGTKTVKQLLDWMAFYKLNKFHWHLTDANGWRLEIKKYPLLTTIGGRGNFTDSLAAARYYTQAEIRDIVSYASVRNITIIPEIDMPGHASASNHAYPEFSGGKVSENPDFTFDPANEGTYTYLSNILTEVASLFPGKMVHLGGDEVTLGIDAWKSNPRVQNMMKEKKFTDFTELEHYFLKRMTDSASKKGLHVICWDEAVSANLPSDKVYIQWWRHNKPNSLTEAISKGYKVILSPRLPLYFDFVQDAAHQSGRKWGGLYNSYLDIYHYPKPNEQLKNVLGVQANIWTETIATDQRLEFLLFPRIAALAESGWTSPEAKSEEKFNLRLKSQIALYKAKGIYFYNPFSTKESSEKIDFKKEKEVID
ncbi:hypothetical protein ASU31_17160 [Pedobacter ginsenosidimutans]|uniref:beta-N-acetylhexosaminidase n=1 Tax=Pedobacter ginsenosidimutans TaxID=687842 RepID=A0A0T5VMI1_9SPHI|nr:beta-N-acetylhexosaminidase [Pedobacter ginsenosidimutans]KRT15041.1 hypothetical protein ASU31_17160 [Pedobacter ginsenosidimutans]